jgi:small-conductance mechanosensitive channel
LSLAEVRCRTFKFNVALHREHLKNLNQVARLAQTEVEEYETIVQLIGKDVLFTQDDLDQRIAFVNTQEKLIREQLNLAENYLRTARRSRPGNEEQPSSTIPETMFAVAREEVQLLQQVLSEVGGVRECWRRRFAFANGDFTPDGLDGWLDAALVARQRIEHLSEKVKFRTEQRQHALAALRRSRKIGEVQDPVEAVSNEERIAELEQLIEFYGSVQALASRGQVLYTRFCDEIYAERETMSFGQLVAQTRLLLAKVWSTELGAVDDRPITVSKVVCGLALLLGGYWLSRLIAGIAALKVLPRLGVSQSSAAPLRNVFFYFLLAGLTFFTLDVVNVPLTVFAFLGGAIAIGVGFGSQNILNNFISGLILMVERPIRIGDLVNVDGIDANIEQIGARSTCVRTGANLEILVPNSKFLENNVTNWTLSDTRIRTSVSVGVAYGSSVKKVIELLTAVVTTHEKVLPSPAPIVLFREFGDNALTFEVHFWIHMQRMMDSARVESDVRIAIDDAFGRAGIVIAFPQRDVHIDFPAPIDVRLSEPGHVATKLHSPHGEGTAA